MDQRSAYTGIIALAAGLLLCGSPAHANNECLRIATHPTPAFPHVIRSLTMAFETRDMCLDVQVVATKRASILLQQGKIDGEMFRIPQYLSNVESFAVMVPEPIVEGYGLLVTNTEDDLNEDNLKDADVAIGVGSKWANLFFPNGANKVILDDYEEALTMLRKGRIKGLLIEDLSLREIDLNGVQLPQKRLTPKLTGHLFLHESRIDQLPEISRLISEWKKDFYKTQEY